MRLIMIRFSSGACLRGLRSFLEIHSHSQSSYFVPRCCNTSSLPLPDTILGRAVEDVSGGSDSDYSIWCDSLQKLVDILVSFISRQRILL